jgi:PAS domain S-box-containing protein
MAGPPERLRSRLDERGKMSETARILLVDGDPHLLRATSRLLNEAGHEVTEAGTGTEGLRSARAQKPDLILVDAVLPDMVGFEFCQRIKEDPNLARCFVVVLGGVTPPSDDQSGKLKGGADAHIARPISEQEFLAWVGAMLRIKRAEAREAHLNRVVHAINHINQLIEREKDRGRLLQDSCDLLVAAHGYYNVWIALFDQAGRLVTTAEAGVGAAFLPLVQQLERGELPDCTRRALAQAQAVVSEEPLATCADCPLAAGYAGRGAMTVRLEHGGKVHGLLCASVPTHYIAEEDQVLLQETAGDIAVALHNLEMEEEHKRVEAERQAHLRFLESMDRVNPAMQGTNDLEQMMSDVLDVVLSIFNCDRVFLLYPCDPQSATWCSPMERTNPEYPGVLTLGLEVPMDAEVAETLCILLASDGPVKFGPGAMHPLPADVSERFGIKSFMSMALHPKVGKPWQFGIHQCSYPRVWTLEEERLLQEIGRRLGDSLTSLLVFRSLRESEQKLRTIFETMEEALALNGLVVDDQGEIIDYEILEVNPAFEHDTGLTREQVVGKKATELYGMSPEYISAFWKAHLHDEHAVKTDMYVDQMQAWKHILTSIPVDGQFVVSYFDITDLKNAETALRASEQKFRSFVEESSEGFTLVDEQGTIIEWNRACEEIRGLSADEVFGRASWDVQYEMLLPELRTPQHYERAKQMTLDALRIGQSPLFNDVVEAEVMRQDGMRQFVQQTIFPIKTDRGYRIGSITRDVTERKRNDAINASRLHLMQFAVTHSLDELLEETLNEAEKLCDSLIGFYHFVEDDQETLTLQNWSTRTKAEFCQAEGKGLHYAISEAGAWVDCVYQRKPVIHNDYASLPHRKGMPAGHAEVVRELVVPVLRGEKIKAILGVGNKASDYMAQDVEAVSLLADLAWEIAERKMAEEALHRLNRELQALSNCNQVLQQSNDLLRAIIEAAPTAIIGLDLEGKVQTVWNPAAEKMLGWSAQEAMGRFLPSVPVDKEEEFRQFRERIRSGQTLNGVEVQRQRRDGTLIDHSLCASPLHDVEGRIVGSVAVLVDITERKRAEHALHQRASQLALLNEVGRRVAALLDLDEVLDRAARLVRELFDFHHVGLFTQAEGEDRLVMRASAGEFAPLFPPDHSVALGQGMVGWVGLHGETLLANDVDAESRYLNSYPERLPTRSELSVPIQTAGKIVGVLDVQSPQPNAFDQNDIVVLETLASQIAVAIENARLFTETQTTLQQLKRTQAQLVQSATLAAIGELAAGVAHEINNPLTSILGFAELVLWQLAPDDPSRQDLEIVVAEAKRSRDIVRNLLDFARQAEPLTEPADVNQVLRQTLALVRAQVEKNGVTIEERYASNLGQIPLDVSRMKQVFLNLITNAVHAMPKGGMLTVSTAQAGDEVAIQITDTGMGIPPRGRERLFEPFFTTRPSGAGLGLSVGLGIVQQHGGRIEVKSQVGEGSTFTVWLPAGGERES